MVFPILIPSKGRPDSKLFNILTESNLDFLVFVEPQDQDSYLENLSESNIVVLPKDNQGLQFSRNHILNYARSHLVESKWFWQLDDDVKQFFTTENNRNVKISAREAFEIAEEYFKESEDTGQAAMEYQRFAWSQKNPYTINSYCDVVVCINIEKTKGLVYGCGTKDDRDFTLQVLASGSKTMRVMKASFSNPTSSTVKGGLYEAYRNGIMEKSVREMIDKWGEEICYQYERKNGTLDARIRWGLVRKLFEDGKLRPANTDHKKF